MMFIYKTAKFAPVWTTVLKHQTLTEHALYEFSFQIQITVCLLEFGRVSSQ